LEPFFGRLRASDVGTGHVQRYIESRRDKDGASAASINRELALLRRAFNLGLRTQPPKVRTVPYFTMLKEPKPRRGFLKPGEHDALAQACSDVGGLWLRSIFEVAITFGFRLHEMVGKNGLRVEQIDFAAGIIRLEITKNGDPRDVAMTGTVRSLLKECCRGKSGRDFVFSRGGDPVVTFNRSWKKACVLAGVAKLLCPECEQELDRERHCADCDRDWNAHQTKYSGLLVHDCRRTAVRDLVRAGVPEKIAMTISGHLSREVFERYNIGDDFDLKEAARKLEAYRAHQTEAAAVLSRETEQPLQSAKLQ
jgi:integrase